MYKPSITVGFALSFLLLVLTAFVLTQALKKQPSANDAAVHMAESELAIPPGFWIEYDPVKQRYRHCHDSYGTVSCWLFFSTKEEAIRDAQAFAEHMPPQ